MKVRDHAAELREDAEELENERCRLKSRMASRLRDAADLIESLAEELRAPRQVSTERTVAEARAKVEANLRKGSTCEVCDQNAQSYNRPIHKRMAEGLVALYREDLHGTDQYFEIVEVFKRRKLDPRAYGGDFAKLRFWGLIDPAPGYHPTSNSKRSGQWRITPLGRRFVQGVRVLKRARLYNNECLGLVEGETISIAEALEKTFDYREILDETG